jgi:cytochrome c oxidase assembly factor CtaG
VTDAYVLAVSWWCQSTKAPWSWTPKIYVGVWIVMALLVVPYALTMRRRAKTVGLDARDKRAILWFSLGAAALWVATDWPIGLLGSGYLLSVHTTIYIIYTMVAAPLMLLGIPAWMARALLDRLHAWGAYRWSVKPWIAAIVLNVALVVTHLPFVVDPFRSSQLGSFVLDAIWLTSGVIGWLPVITPFRGDRIKAPIWKCVYLFVAFGAFPMLPGAFITFSPLPLYRVYELAPRFGSWTPEDDQQLAGALMKVGNVPILWSVIAAVFIKSALEQRKVEMRGHFVDDEGNPLPPDPGPTEPATASPSGAAATPSGPSNPSPPSAPVG